MPPGRNDIKRFIQRFALFCAPLAMMAGVVEWSLTRLPNSYRAKLDYLSSSQDEIEILTFGSSQGLHGVDPTVLGRPAFNLSNGSQSLMIDFQLARALSPRLPKLKTVVFTLSYMSFEYRLCDSREAWRTGFYKRYFGIEGDCADRKLLDPSRLSLALLYGTPQVPSLLLHPEAQRASISQIHRDGFQPNPGHIDVTDAYAREAVFLHEEGMRISTRAAILREARGVLDQLEGRGIQVVFVWMPVRDEYLKYASPARLAASKEALASLVRGREHVHVLDFLTDRRVPATEYVDTHHLNPDGARDFTAILREELSKLRPERRA